MSLALRYAARSDRGLLRQNNQDSVYAGPRLLAVADGMGGMAGGEVASNIVVAALAPLDEDAPSGDLVDALRQSIGSANEELRGAVEDNPALEGMGTTLTAMLFSSAKIALAHVGDSRAYLLRDGELIQITKDDTYVQMLVDEGRISADEASTHPQRSLLTRALDGRDVEPDFSVRESKPGDRFLLCSDGLSGVVSKETLTEALSIEDPAESADRLIGLALRGGGPDNITCIVADVVDVPVGDDAPVVGGAAARDRGRASAAGADSAAGRAALASPRPVAEPEPEEEEIPRPRRRPVRTALLSVIALGAVAALGWLTWNYTQSQYYVGESDEHVAVYRGVRGSVAGVELSSVSSRSEIRIEDLTQVNQRKVEEGIPAEDRADADRIIRNLDQKPECPATPSPAPSPSPPQPTVTPSAPSRPATPPPSPATPASSPASPTGSPAPSTPADGGAGEDEDCRRPR